MHPFAPALAVFALISLAPTARADTPDAGTLAIEMGRWEVMLSEIFQVTPQLHGSAETPFQDANPEHMNERLRDAVWQFNQTRDRLCFFGVEPGLSCAPAFAPDWLVAAPDQPDLAELQRRSDAFSDVMIPYWDAICERVRKGRPEAERLEVCPME